eukprot:2305883-Amphidinium_carterae.1
MMRTATMNGFEQTKGMLTATDDLGSLRCRPSGKHDGHHNRSDKGMDQQEDRHQLSIREWKGH